MSNVQSRAFGTVPIVAPENFVLATRETGTATCPLPSQNSSTTRCRPELVISASLLATARTVRSHR